MEKYSCVILIHQPVNTSVDVQDLVQELSHQFTSSTINSYQWLSPNDALELCLDIHSKDLSLLKTLRKTSQGHHIAFMKSNVFYRHKRLVVFDMDSTLIQQECIDELARIAHVVDKVSVQFLCAFCFEIKIIKRNLNGLENK